MSDDHRNGDIRSRCAIVEAVHLQRRHSRLYDCIGIASLVLIASACAGQKPSPAQATVVHQAHLPRTPEKRVLYDRASPAFEELAKDRDAEKLLREGISAYQSRDSSPLVLSDSLLQRIIRVRLQSRVNVYSSLGVKGACLTLQAMVRDYFSYRNVGERGDEEVLLHSCSLLKDGSGDFLVKWRRSFTYPRKAYCEERRSWDEKAFVDEHPKGKEPYELSAEEADEEYDDSQVTWHELYNEARFYRGCDPGERTTSGTYPWPTATSEEEARLSAAGDEQRGRLLFLDQLGRGRKVRGFPVFSGASDLYPHEIELPDSMEKVAAYVRTHPEQRFILREAALRRALELGTTAGEDHLVSAFAEEFCRDFGLHADEIASVMRRDFEQLGSEACVIAEGRR